jgi:hypothetical protein
LGGGPRFPRPVYRDDGNRRAPSTEVVIPSLEDSVDWEPLRCPDIRREHQGRSMLIGTASTKSR